MGGMSRKLERMSSYDGADSLSMRSPRAPKADFKEAARSSIEKLSEKQRDLLLQRVQKTILDAMRAEVRKASGAKSVADEFCMAMQEHVAGAYAVPMRSIRLVVSDLTLPAVSFRMQLRRSSTSPELRLETSKKGSRSS